MAGNDDDGGGVGVFTSPDINVSKIYAEDGGVIALDSAKILADGFEIAPYFYTGSSVEEYIIDVSNRDLKPISNYVISISISEKNFQTAKASFNHNKNAFYNEYEWNRYDEYIFACAKTFNFPFILT